MASPFTRANLLFAALLGFWALPVAAQEAFTLADTVWIVAPRQQALQPGGRKVTIDSVARQEMRGQNLADVLAAHSDVFVKSYGSGSLATTSLRGGGASHTALVWNGFSLQSPMNGQADMALLPAFFLDQIHIHYGGGAALFGSGAVGGAIHLENKTHFTPGKQAAVYLNTGSFGFFQPGIDLQFADGKRSSRTRAFFRTAENDFRLPNGMRQPHASLMQGGVLQEFAAKLTARQQARLWIWAQHSDRNLPPPLSADTGAAAQSDQAFRLAADWSWTSGRLQAQARSAWIAERLRYTDDVSAIASLNRSHSLIQEAEMRFLPAKGPEIHAGVNHTFQLAAADGYGTDTPRQQQAALFASARWRSASLRWEAVVSVRQGVIDGKMAPLTPTAGFRGRLNDWLQVHGQAGRSVRTPTFNDLYWQPGGNPDLKPETGWHQELGLKAEKVTGPFTVQGSVTAFAQQINDWILWRPGRAFWYPENVRSVFSRGMEADASAKTEVGKWLLSARVGYTFTRSTVTSVAQERDLSLGKQLIYTPMHQARACLRAQRGPVSLSYVHTYTGKRFTATDNSAALAPYQLGVIWGSWKFNLGKNALQAGLRADNLFNVQYQVMENRAMPTRSFQFTLDFFLHHLP